MKLIASAQSSQMLNASYSRHQVDLGLSAGSISITSSLLDTFSLLQS
jgi:hypothetical protein